MNRGETMDIGQRIRFVRLFRGMKQEELAEKIGLGGGENGRTRISQYCRASYSITEKMQFILTCPGS